MVTGGKSYDGLYKFSKILYETDSVQEDYWWLKLWIANLITTCDVDFKTYFI